MENKMSYVCGRDPSVDRRCRPAPYCPTLCDLTESTDESDSDNNLIESPKSSRTASIESIVTLEAALVYLRFRPVSSSSSLSFNNKQLYRINHDTLIVSDSSIQKKTEKQFKFTDIFDENIQQHTVYERCVHQKIQSEENLTILTYGTSGSGKTFTLLGDINNPGIIPRALENIFKQYEGSIYPFPAVKIENAKLRFLSDDDIIKEKIKRDIILGDVDEIKKVYNEVKISINQHHNFEIKKMTEPTSVHIWISFVEIYNETVNDLLSIDGTKKQDLKVIINQGKSFIKNVTSVYVKNSLEAYTILSNGLKKVSYASTQINNHSSRSHSIVFVDIISYAESGVFFETFYKFCDLAGSERLGKTGNINVRLKETQQINKSLLVLGRCLDVAYQNQLKKVKDVIPYRESKLTMLLYQALAGKERLTMIVNILPTEEYYEENLNVLHFSAIAKNIIYKTPKIKKTKSRFSWLSNPVKSIHDDKNYEEAYEKLLEENISLNSQIEELKRELIRQEADIKKKLCDWHEETLQGYVEIWETKLLNTEKSLTKNFEIKIEKLERKYKREIEELQEEIDELIEDKEDLHKENRKLTKDNENLIKEKDELMKDKENLLKDKENLCKEKNDLMKEKDDLLKEIDELLKDKNNLLKEKNELMKNSENLLCERYGPMKEIGNLLGTHDGLEENKENLIDL